jgi:hypothetical protein
VSGVRELALLQTFLLLGLDALLCTAEVKPGQKRVRFQCERDPTLRLEWDLAPPPGFRSGRCAPARFMSERSRHPSEPARQARRVSFRLCIRLRPTPCLRIRQPTIFPPPGDGGAAHTPAHTPTAQPACVRVQRNATRRRGLPASGGAHGRRRKPRSRRGFRRKRGSCKE